MRRPYCGGMATFKPGQRVTTESGNLMGTVVEVLDADCVLLEWDDEAGPQEDEVPVSLLHAVTPLDSQAPHLPHGSGPPR